MECTKKDHSRVERTDMEVVRRHHQRVIAKSTAIIEQTQDQTLQLITAKNLLDRQKMAHQVFDDEGGPTKRRCLLIPQSRIEDEEIWDRIGMMFRVTRLRCTG